MRPKMGLATVKVALVAQRPITKYFCMQIVVILKLKALFDKMPRCCVPNCVETGGHQFPRDVKLKKLWLKAIRRLKFEPKSGARVCHKHFKESDYEKIGKYSGMYRNCLNIH